MTVAELIEKLLSANDDAEVYVDLSSYWAPVESVEIDEDGTVNIRTGD